MSIMINKDKCVGCKKCLDVCPGSLIKYDTENKKSYMKYPKDCWGCCSCIKECPKDAISLFLGADIGGNGSQMTVNLTESNAVWKISKSDKEEVTININRKDSNKY